MATLEGYKPYSPTWEGVGTQFAISLTISFACLTTHEFLRNSSGFRHLFSARCYLEKNRSPPPSKKLLGWIVDVWRIEETFILHNVGLDAVFYLRFLKMLLQIMIFMVLIIMPILIPVDYINRVESDQLSGTVEEFSITGIDNQDYKLWIHTFLNSTMTIFILYLIYRNTAEFVQLRRIHFLKEANEGNPRCRTVMVTNIPDPLCDEDCLRDHFEALGLGEVNYVQMLRYPTKLIEYRKRRKKALIELERAHTQLARNFLKAIKSGDLTEQIFVDHGKLWEFQEIQRYLQDPESFGLSGKLESRNRLILRQSIESDTMSIWDLLFNLDAVILDPYHPQHSNGNIAGGSRRSVDYWYEKLVILDRRISVLRSGTAGGGRCGTSIHTLDTSTAFVTFTNPASAQLCAQSIIHPSINCCQTYLAPEPKDIIWHNHTLSRSSRISRKVVVNAITWALIILWLIPVLSFLPIMSFDTLSKNYPIVEEFSRTHPWVQTMLNTIVPAIFVACFMSTLPHILYYTSTMEAWKTHSLCERTAAMRYYYFCIFNVLFLFLLGPPIFSIFINAINNQYNIIQVFATKIPNGAAFFINFVIFNTCYQFMELLCVACPFMLSVGSWLFPRTPRERKVFEHTWSFPFYYYIPNHLLIFVIVMTYATVNSIIIPVGFLYFGSAYFVFKHQFVYTYIKQYESNGRIWNLLVRFLTDGLVIAQLTTGFIVALKLNYFAVIPIIITLFITFYFKFYYRKVFRLRLKYVPLVSLKEAETNSHSSDDVNDIDSPKEVLPEFNNKQIPSVRYSANRFAPKDDYEASSYALDQDVLSMNNNDAERGLNHRVIANGNNEIQEQQIPGYFAQAFSHPALVKPIPNAMLLCKYPLRYHYDLYEDVLDVDVVAPSLSCNVPRDIANPSIFSGTCVTENDLNEPTYYNNLAPDTFNPDSFINISSGQVEPMTPSIETNHHI